MRLLTLAVILISRCALAADVAAPADLNGKIAGPEGLPATGTVMVLNALTKEGNKPVESTDLGKTATTDAEGKFTIAGVDSSNIYELLIVADGYRPTLKKVDPARGEVNAKVQPPPKDVEPELILKGHVVDSEGKPVVGAYVEPTGYQEGQTHYFGSTGQYDRETWTDAKGEFTIYCKKSAIQVDVRVRAPNMAPILCPLLPVGDQTHEVQLTPGASVIGRVLKDGQPLGGVALKLSQSNRSSATWIGDFTATTSDDGAFHFTHVKPNEAYTLCTTMSSLGERGCLPIQLCRVNEEGSTFDNGDLKIEPAFVVSGKLTCSDQKPVPTGTKVVLSREQASDSLTATADAEGKFEFKGVPSEVCRLSVDAKGYHVSKDNTSFEALNAFWLMGLVDDNISDLNVQIDPGPREPQNHNAAGNWQMLRTTRLQGIAPP